MKGVVFSGLVMLLMCGVMTAQAQQMNTDDILGKYYEAVGGLDKIKGIQSIKSSGTIFIAMQGLSLPFVTYNVRPNKLRVNSTFQGSTIVQASDGENAWMINPFMGSNDPLPMPEAQAASFMEQADMDGHLVGYKDKGSTIEVIGAEDETTMHHLKVTLANGEVRHYYLDATTYLPKKVVGSMDQMGQNIEVETWMSDYKEVEGMMVAHTIEQKVNGQTQTKITLETIEPDAEIDGNLFTMPKKTGQ